MKYETRSIALNSLTVSNTRGCMNWKWIDIEPNYVLFS